MLIEHFEKTRPEILGFFTYENISQVVCDLEIHREYRGVLTLMLILLKKFDNGVK